MPIDSALRRLIPCLASLSHNRLVMAPLDLLDRLISLPCPAWRYLPPNRFRIRTGVGNWILGNQSLFLQDGKRQWQRLCDHGLAGPETALLDLGCGCGRLAFAMAPPGAAAPAFEGQYTGVDIDAEMLAWCRQTFPGAHFRFLRMEMPSQAYRSDGHAAAEQPALKVGDASQDLVHGNSLFTHLLEPELRYYLREAARTLRPGGHLWATVFSLDHVRTRPSYGDRWTFRHRAGPAWVENEACPEAAVAYEEEFLRHVCEASGFKNVSVNPGHVQDVLRAQR